MKSFYQSESKTTIFDDTIFKDFVTNCIGTIEHPEKEQLIKYVEKVLYTFEDKHNFVVILLDNYKLMNMFIRSLIENFFTKDYSDYLVDDILGTTRIIAPDIMNDFKTTIDNLYTNNVNKLTKILSDLTDNIEYKLNNINISDDDKQKMKTKINEIKQSKDISHVDKINTIIKSIKNMSNKINIDNINISVNTEPIMQLKNKIK